jgi:hypothetical protein
MATSVPIDPLVQDSTVPYHESNEANESHSGYENDVDNRISAGEFSNLPALDTKGYKYLVLQNSNAPGKTSYIPTSPIFTIPDTSVFPNSSTFPSIATLTQFDIESLATWHNRLLHLNRIMVSNPEAWLNDQVQFEEYRLDMAIKLTAAIIEKYFRELPSH